MIQVGEGRCVCVGRIQTRKRSNTNQGLYYEIEDQSGARAAGRGGGSVVGGGG